MVFYILYKLSFIVANILPLKAAYWLAERFSDIQYRLAKRDREAVAQNLSRVLGKDISECRVIAQKVFRNFGMYLVDFFRLTRFDSKALEKRVRIEGIENLDNALKQNKGAIILSCHLGNWEMGGVTVAVMGYDISAVALTHKHKNINQFFINQREKRGLKVISVGPIMKRCMSTLLKKGILALVGDRDFTNSGIVLNFFGIPTSIPKGPVILSLKAGSPIVPGFLIREDRYKYKFIFDTPIEVKKIPDASEEEIIKRTMEQMVSVMEKYIRRFPEQWLVFRKFWEAPVDVFVL